MDLATLHENFDLLADAPNGAQRLRQMILRLAVQGKLVPQNPNDEPASALRQRNQVEKARLIKEGKLNKSQSLPPIDPDEVPFEAPAGWEWVRLGNAARLRRGFDLPVGVRKAGAVPVYGANGPLGTHSEAPLHGPGVVTGRSGSIGKVHYVAGNYWPLNTALYVEDFWGNEPRFVELLLRAADLERFSSFSAVPTLNRNVAHFEPVLVPPLAEQHRIVAKVDELMGLCDELEERQKRQAEVLGKANAAALDRLLNATGSDDFDRHWRRLCDHFHILFDNPDNVAELRKAILQLAVQGKLVPQDPNDEPASVLLEKIQAEKARLVKEGKLKRSKPLPLVDPEEMPFEVPTGWAFRRIGEVTEVSGGVTLGRKLGSQATCHLPYLRVANVQEGHVDLSVVKEVQVRKDEVERYRLLRGDVLLTEGGDWDKLGRSAIWDGALPLCLHQNHVFRARPDSRVLTSRWLSMFTNARTGREYFQSASKQTTNLASINMTQLKHCPLPLPPLAEQHRIVTRVDELMALCDELENGLREGLVVREQLATAMAEGVA